MAEDSDDEIFVTYQCKPVNPINLSRKDIVRIKYGVIKEAEELARKARETGIISSESDDSDDSDSENLPAAAGTAQLHVETYERTQRQEMTKCNKNAPPPPPALMPKHATPVKRLAQETSCSSPSAKQRRLAVKSPSVQSPQNTILNYFTRTPSPKKSPIPVSVRSNLQLALSTCSSSQERAEVEAACLSLRKHVTLKPKVPVAHPLRVPFIVSGKMKIAPSERANVEIITLPDSEGSQEMESPKSKSPDVKKKSVASEAPPPPIEKITLSPGVRKRINRFKSIGKVADKDKKAGVKKALFKVPSMTETAKPAVAKAGPSRLKTLKCLKRAMSANAHKPSSESDGGTSAVSDSSSKTGSDLDSQILGTVFEKVIVQQDYLKTNALQTGGFFESLLSEFDLSVAEQYFRLDVNQQTLFMRMFFRKEGWHRVSALKYEDLGEDLGALVKSLVSAGLFDGNLKAAPITEILDLLQTPELTQLARLFNIPGLTKKKDMIDQLMKQAKTQKSVADIFKNRGGCSRLALIEQEACKLLGPCFQLAPQWRNSVSLFLLLFSLSHDVDDESKRNVSQRLLLHNVLRNQTEFVDYVVVPAVVFEVRADLLLYNEALKLRQKMDTAFMNKSHPIILQVAHIARDKFTQLLSNNEFRERVYRLPTYLRRFNAAAVYASILTMFCENFKRKFDPKEAETILKLLLSQKTFSLGSRGKWHELLVMNLQAAKRVEEAGQALLEASNDPHIDEVKRFALQIRAQGIIKLKEKKLKNSDIRKGLCSFSSVTRAEPVSIEVAGQAMSGQQGSKLVYVRNTATGKHLSSVEEEAIAHYKKHGYFQGIHCEGFIVSTIFHLLFFDLIYDVKTPGVFLSCYQTKPLDMGSTAFFHNREVELQSRLLEMVDWTQQQVKDRVERVFANYGSTSCVITWKKEFTPRIFCEIIDCLGMPAVTAICKRFAFKPRQARSGFPDLTLWHPLTKKYKFVEVKSPNDRLAPNQRVWLDYLMENQIHCEVCNVKNVGGKQQ